MWDWFINFITQVLVQLDTMTGDLGLSIIIVTVIIRIAILPLMNKSTASTARMQVLQPKVQEIQDRYADDPQRLNDELRKFQAENNFNPLGGCLPVLIQMPIFMCFFTAARQITEVVAEKGLSTSFYNVIADLSTSASSTFFSAGLTAALPLILLDVAFGVLTFIPMVINLKTMTDEDQKRQTLVMGIVMSVMMLWFGWSVPAAVLLYYDTSALWQVVQQQLVTKRVMEKAKAEAEANLANKPKQIYVERRERKPRPKKKH